MSATDTWTVGRLLTWTTEFLTKHGSPSARLDAEILLAHARHCKRIELYTSYDDEPDEHVRGAFRDAVKRRAEGTPVAYLVGYKEFYAAPFEVTPDVLIPRPETEHLVVEALDRGKLISARPLRVADVGTGSGVIAITLAKHLADCQVTAIDCSSAALAVARRNAEKHGIAAEQITWIEGDLLADCDPECSFEMIVSNPPYVSEAEYEQLDKTVRDYEPKQALVAGPTGMEIISRLIAQAQQRLNSGGYFIFEFSPMLADHLQQQLGDGWEAPQVTNDLAGHARVVTIRKQ